MSVCTCYIERIGIEHEVEVIFSSYGSRIPATREEPEEYPEIEITEIWENPKGMCEFEATARELEYLIEKVADYLNDKGGEE